MNKISDWIKAACGKLPSLCGTSESMVVVWLFWSAWVSLFLLFVASYCGNWYESGKADLPALTAFLQTNIGPAAIAAIGFLGKALIDKDKDGIPDEFEEKKG